jgi:alpha-glucosidase
MPWSSFSPHGGFSEVRPWLPVSPEHLSLAVDQQEKDPDSVLHMFRRFVAWRKEQPALIRGGIRLLPSDGPILAFERSLDRDCILCFFNFSNHEAIQELEAEWPPIAEAGFRSSLDSGRVYLQPFGAWFGAARLSHGR